MTPKIGEGKGRPRDGIPLGGLGTEECAHVATVGGHGVRGEVSDVAELGHKRGDEPTERPRGGGGRGHPYPTTVACPERQASRAASERAWRARFRSCFCLMRGTGGARSPKFTFMGWKSRTSGFAM